MREKIIAQSWERCKGHGISSQTRSYEVLSCAQLKQRLEQIEDIYYFAKSIFNELQADINQGDYIFTLADTDGYILYQSGTDESNSNIGTNWSEEFQGTNAIGTTIITGKTITVFGEEHFRCENRALACTSAPVFSPYTNEFVGVVDISGLHIDYNPFHQALINRVSELIQNKILLQGTVGKLTTLIASKENRQEADIKALFVLNKANKIIAHNRNAFDICNQNLLNQSFNSLFSKSTVNIEQILEGHSPCELKVKAALGSSPKLKSFYLNFIPSKDSKYFGNTIYLSHINQEPDRENLIPDQIISKNPKLIRAKEMALLAAESDCSILIEAETGTGKELFARLIHQHSPRKDAPFIPINCAAIPENLIGSELFGYEEGAFTGAKKSGQAGKFELADQGTLFLDEIGDMSLESQKYLLRVLEEKCFTRIGGRKIIPADVRIIAATHKNLSEQVTRGNFRADLLYRLNTLTINLPALRNRKEDILLLGDYFLQKYNHKYRKNIRNIQEEVKEIFLAYDWPGNIRELKNMIERAVILTKGKTIGCNSLPSNLFQNKKLDLNKLTSEELEEILRQNKYNISKTARQLKIARNTLYKRMDLLGIKT